ncbi:MAG: hypothetical protein CMJ32_02315 [Phycisphaerae bacterium]|nr:hypothetical protein [Phycisphaerae bacterium]
MLLSMGTTATTTSTLEKSGEIRYYDIFKTWLPLGMTQFLLTAEDPIYIAVIMRLANPELELAALYTYTWALIGVIASLTYTMNTIGNVFGTNTRNLSRIGILSMIMGLMCTTVICLGAFTPFGRNLLQNWMAIPDANMDMVIKSLRIMSIFPLFISMNILMQGILIRNGHAKDILLSRMVRFLIGLGILMLGLKTAWFEGAVLGALAVVISMLVQTALLWLMTRKVRARIRCEPLESEVVGIGELVRFTIPISISPALSSISTLVMSAAIGRLPGVIASLAVWPVVTNFNSIGMGMGSSYSQVTTKHFEKPEDDRKLYRFGMCLGLLLSILTIVFIVTGVFMIALRDLEKLDDQIAQISVYTMWILAFMPLTYTMGAYYIGMLSKTQNTMPVMISQMIALAVVFTMLMVSINMKPFMGVYVVALSQLIGALVSLAWLWYAWRRVRPGLEPREQEEQAAGDGQPDV